MVSISLGATRELGKLREGLEEKNFSDGFFWFEVEKWLQKRWWGAVGFLWFYLGCCFLNVLGSLLYLSLRWFEFQLLYFQGVSIYESCKLKRVHIQCLASGLTIKTQ